MSLKISLLGSVFNIVGGIGIGFYAGKGFFDPNYTADLSIDYPIAIFVVMVVFGIVFRILDIRHKNSLLQRESELHDFDVHNASSSIKSLREQVESLKHEKFIIDQTLSNIASKTLLRSGIVENIVREEVSRQLAERDDEVEDGEGC